MLLRARIVALTTAVGMFSMVFAGVAWAPRYLMLPQQLEGDCVLPNGGAGAWTGSFGIDGFAADEGTLVASGGLTGTCFAIDEANNDEPLSDESALALIASIKTTPTQITIDIATIDTLQEPLVVLTLVDTEIVLTADPDSKQELAKFSSLHRTLQKRSPVEAVGQLNAVLGLR